MRRLLSGALASIFTCLVIIAGTAGASGDDPSARGDVGYDAYGLHRNLAFNVEAFSNRCAPWNINGSYTIDFMLNGSTVPFIHDATITMQNAAGGYKISGGYPAGGPFTYAWTGTGIVSGSTVTNSIDYTLGAPGTHMQMTGTIAANGTMNGTWTDNFGGTRNGTWTTASGAATPIFGCRGDGTFHYTDASGGKYWVDVRYVKVSGANVWIAGPVTKASDASWVGNWVFAKAHDGGKSGDQVSGSFTTESMAKLGVATMANPADGPFAVTKGNVVVNP